MSETILVRLKAYDPRRGHVLRRFAYRGWHTVEAEIAPRHTALVVMHAWDCGQPHEYPGWRRAVEYTPRAEKILTEVFPRLLAAVRRLNRIDTPWTSTGCRCAAACSGPSGG